MGIHASEDLAVEFHRYGPRAGQISADLALDDSVATTDLRARQLAPGRVVVGKKAQGEGSKRIASLCRSFAVRTSCGRTRRGVLDRSQLPLGGERRSRIRVCRSRRRLFWPGPACGRSRRARSLPARIADVLLQEGQGSLQGGACRRAEGGAGRRGTQAARNSRSRRARRRAQGEPPAGCAARQAADAALQARQARDRDASFDTRLRVAANESAGAPHGLRRGPFQPRLSLQPLSFRSVSIGRRVPGVPRRGGNTRSARRASARFFHRRRDDHRNR